MKTPEQIQNKIKELENDYKKINIEYEDYITGSDVSITLYVLECEIGMLKWALE